MGFNMSTTVSKIINLAQSWIGKNEKDGSFKEIIDIYNSHKPLARGYKVKYTDEWCATTISALAIKSGATDIIPTECSCQKFIDLCKSKGIWIENENRTPNPGDIILYDWNDDGKGDDKGWADHIGIVEKVSGKTITVIEGNYNQKVARRTIQVNGKFIRGYVVPKYAAEQTEPKKKSVTTIAKEVIAGKWGNGSERKMNLEKAGYNYSEVQKKVNELAGTKTNTTKGIKVGSTVKVKKGAKTFNGGSLASFVYERNHQVKEINVDRVVITYQGTVVAAVRKSDLTVVD
jgi:hypothetical protein